MKFSTIVCLMATLLLISGCSGVNQILDQTQLKTISGKVTSAVSFEFGHMLNKAQLIIVKFEKRDPMYFFSAKEVDFWINEVNTVLYIELPSKIETSFITDEGIEINAILRNQIIEVKRGGF